MTFLPTHCIFQGLVTRRTIDNGRAHGGYTLHLQTTSQALRADNTLAVKQLLQWHRRLRRPSFGLMQRLFSSLFRQCSNHNFACDACELAKHRRFSCPSSLNKSSAPFMIVHSDVWGPFCVVSISGYRWFVTFIDCGFI